MINTQKVKIVIRNVYGKQKPYYWLNKEKYYIKNKKAIYGPDFNPLIKVVTNQLNAREI